MSQDPLQKLWQSEQLNLPVEAIMRQAKAKQRRMFWFMATDVLFWLGVVVLASWHMYQNSMPGVFGLGLFSIIVTSVMVGYLLWLRTSTWGIDSLDVRNTLKLSIRRCEAGIQLGWVSILCCFIVAIAVIIFSHIYPEHYKQRWLFIYTWSIGWCIACYLGYWWYGKKQRKKIAHYRSLLNQLKQVEK